MPSTSRRTDALRRRILTVAGGGLAVSAVAAVLLATAVPAGAHAVIDSHSAVPVDTDETLNMYVPHERADSVYNVEVEIKIPDGWTNAACVAKASWTCTLDAGGTVVHFTKQDASLMVDNENFPFSVHTPSNIATFPFPTIQRYSSGEEVAWIGAPGTPEPAPTLRTVARGVTPTDPAPTAPPHPAPTSPTPGPAPTQPATGGQAPVPGQPTPPAAGGGAATTTAPGETTTTTAPDPGGVDGGGTVPASASPGTTRGDSASGRDVVVEGDEETAAGITASDEPGSAVPVIATGTVVVALLAAGGALAVRKRAPATVAGDADPAGPDVEVIAPDETEPPTP